jgi:predicted nucleic acid-binding protein
MIFVDTGAWAAFFVPRDPSHGAAVEWMEHNEQLLITTDYILDELLTLLKMRYSVAAAVQAGNQLWREQYSRVLYMPPADIHEAWRLFQSHHDKG